MGDVWSFNTKGFITQLDYPIGGKSEMLFPNI